MRGEVTDKGEIHIIFSHLEIRLAIYTCEFLALTLEASGFKMDNLWAFALELRKHNSNRMGAGHPFAEVNDFNSPIK